MRLHGAWVIMCKVLGIVLSSYRDAFVVAFGLNSVAARALARVLWPMRLPRGRIACCILSMGNSHRVVFVFSFFTWIRRRFFAFVLFGGLIHFKIYSIAWVRWTILRGTHGKPVCFTFTAHRVAKGITSCLPNAADFSFYFVIFFSLLQRNWCAARICHLCIHTRITCVSGGLSFAITK